LKCIKTFNLGVTDSYDNYGKNMCFVQNTYFNHSEINTDSVNCQNGDNNLEDLEIFLNKLGSNNHDQIKKMCKIIKKITNIVMPGYKKESYWLTIRVTQEDHNFDIPRWHCDGYYMGFDRRDDLSKFATVLIGPGTLFIKTDEDDRNNFLLIQNEEYKKSVERNGPNSNTEDDEYRKQMDIKITGNRVQSNNSQAVIFMAGNHETCGIHSEPPKHKPRMFLSIVPGSVEEINNWRNDKIIRKSKMIGGDANYHLKYLKYKQKCAQLKRILKI
jgi:hypothetical protein